MKNDRTDVYCLAEELKVNSDHLLRLVEATELLGFATITQGDFILSSLGETFAEASILARKEMLATRIRRLPIFRWLMAVLKASHNSQPEWDVVQTALEWEFPPEEAQRQLDTAVNWGRYAELLACADNDELIYLEPAGNVPPHGHENKENGSQQLD
jgi:NitT/TauT family transport system ATP-binding protein